MAIMTDWLPTNTKYWPDTRAGYDRLSEMYDVWREGKEGPVEQYEVWWCIDIISL